MNQAVGVGTDGTTTSIGQWLDGGNSAGPYSIYVTESDMSRPSPANLWLFLDEHPDSINDGAFAVEEVDITDNSATWVDHASCLHDGACGFSFCDGHAIVRKWTESSWKSTLNYTVSYTGNFGVPNPVTGFGNTADLRWIAGHTSAKVTQPRTLVSPGAGLLTGTDKSRSGGGDHRRFRRREQAIFCCRDGKKSLTEVAGCGSCLLVTNLMKAAKTLRPSHSCVPILAIEIATNVDIFSLGAAVAACHNP